MDQETLVAYNRDADKHAKMQLGLEPKRLYEFIRTYFVPGSPSADIGCGAGRDTAWLAANNFPADGFDASPAMLAHARTNHPKINFNESTLPELRNLADGSFENVLASAVLMHVEPKDLITACLNLLRVSAPGGRIILTFRASRATSEREDDGRLYTPIAAGKLALLFESLGATVLLREAVPAEDRPEIVWTHLVIQKNSAVDRSGLFRIQEIIVRDDKSATYKLALLRALCAVSRNEGALTAWEVTPAGTFVSVPARRLALWWLRYYWPFLTQPKYIKQMHGRGAAGKQPEVFTIMRSLVAKYKTAAGLNELLYDYDSGTRRAELQKSLDKIAATILKNPAYFAGGPGARVFTPVSTAQARKLSRLDEWEAGWITMPERLWRDISLFSHWIEESVILEWARLTEAMNDGQGFAHYLMLLMQTSLVAERDTNRARELLDQCEDLRCVWSGRRLAAFDVDHVVPFAVWQNNDLWNLLPAHKAINIKKSDKIPTTDTIRCAADKIIRYWSLYRSHLPELMDLQMQRALGVNPAADKRTWQTQAIGGLIETSERLALSRGLERWAPNV